MRKLIVIALTALTFGLIGCAGEPTNKQRIESGSLSSLVR